MNITVYTMQGCSFCQQLKKFLSDKQITYVERDISKNENFRNEFLDRKGQAVPLTIINDEQEFLGFNDALKSALEELS
ncbi:glutaredoxin family protein [Bacillus sp. APMAM]|nr:glutaredoxin family protein [Bacillus sp. APMAM]RTZ55784.1 glutaredoxin family protein [Bacillus sp. SAJ1]